MVYIASPHTSHCEMTVAALRAGKHVLCEKPIAVNAAEARTMVDTARREGRFLMEAMWTWFIPAIVDIKRRIEAGEIGRLTVIESDFGITVVDEGGRHRRIDLAGGALLDLGIYPISLARFLTGDPAGTLTDVRALARLGPSGVDSTLGGVLRIGDDVMSRVPHVPRRHLDPAGHDHRERRSDRHRSAVLVQRGLHPAPQRPAEPSTSRCRTRGWPTRRPTPWRACASGNLESDVIPLDVSIAHDGDPRRDPPPGGRGLPRRMACIGV